MCGVILEENILISEFFLIYYSTYKFIVFINYCTHNVIFLNVYQLGTYF